MATSTAVLANETEIANALNVFGLGNFVPSVLDEIEKGLESKIHNDYKNDAIEIPVVKKMRFKFKRPTKLEFV